MTTPTSTHGERDNGDSPTYRAALEYVRRGWRIVALHWVTPAGACSCRAGAACKNAGKHPRDSAWQREGNPPERWAPGHPGERENIGTLTGKASGFWVLDFDPDDADDAGTQLRERLRDYGIEPHVRTGGGGYHWRFWMPDDGREIRNRQTAGGGRGRTHSLPRGWDVRGDGGQVVAPPSVSAKGPYVEIETSLTLPYRSPEWLLEMVAAPERDAPPDHTVPEALADLPSAPNPQPGGLGAGTESRVGVASGGSSHPAVRIQAYAIGALQAECSEYAQLTDGRRGEAAAAFARSLVEIANLAGWSTVAGGEVYCWFERAMLAAAQNGGGGGYAPHEIGGQWERAREHVGGRARVMTDAIDVLPAPDMAVSERAIGGEAAAAVADLGFHIVEPGAPFGGHGSTTYGAHAGVTGQGTGGTPAPNGPPPAPPVGMDALTWSQVLRQDAAENAKRYRAARDLGARPPLASEALTGDTLDLVADPVPLIEGWLFMDTLARINGKPGQGKSFIAADLALSVATGTPWRGVPVRQGPVVALVAEGLSGFKQRVRAWESDRGRKAGGMLHLFPRAVQALGPEWAEFVEWAASVRPVLITLDTQARISVGVKENDPTAQGELVHALEELRRRTGAVVLVIHHAAKAGTDDAGRGSNAMEGAMVSEFFVTKSGFDITLKTTKQKDIEAPKPVKMTLKKVGESAVIDGGVAIAEPGRDMDRERAIALYHIMQRHFGGDGGMGGTRAQIDAHLKTDGSMAGLNMASGQNGPKAILAAWRALISRGLVIKSDRADRYRVIEFATTGPEGVLTPNAGEHYAEEPAGWSTWCPEAATLAAASKVIPVPPVKEEKGQK